MIKMLKSLRKKRKNWRTQVIPIFSALLNSVENEGLFSISGAIVLWKPLGEYHSL